MRSVVTQLYGFIHCNNLTAVLSFLPVRDSHGKYNKAVANGPVGQVLAGPLFLKVKTQASNKQKY